MADQPQNNQQDLTDDEMMQAAKQLAGIEPIPEPITEK
jgi:hypothetical protein